MAAAKQIYTPAKNPRTGQEIFPALQPGSELGWAGLAGPEPVREAVEFFQYVVANDPKWDFRTLDFDRDVARAEKSASQVIDAIDPNLQPFFARGGKVLMYHGWNDQLVAPMNSVNYYQAVVGATRGSAESIRLFMMPGMTHCRGGAGPDSFDRMGVIERWVEKGEAPKQIIAEHLTSGVVDRRRPLCPHPEVATYTGAGSLDEAASFSCRHRRGETVKSHSIVLIEAPPLPRLAGSRAIWSASFPDPWASAAAGGGKALRGSDLIVHAGDVGDVMVLEQLSAIAPTFAVRTLTPACGREAGP